MDITKAVFINPTVDAIARQLLTVGGTYLVTKGYIDAGTAAEVVGAIIVLASLTWSVFHKKQNPV